jgi:hypothetical protein
MERVLQSQIFGNSRISAVKEFYRLGHPDWNERCCVAACPRPAAPGSHKCRSHNLERDEPTYFESRQPSLAVLQQAKFAHLAIPDDIVFAAMNGRARDRRRQAFEHLRRQEAE